MNDKKDIIIVTDPGADDAIAIMYAIFCREFNIKLLCIAGGNSSIENTTNNALFLMQLFKQDIPVAVGPQKPLKRESVFATNAQGAGGLGGYKVKEKKLTKKAIDTPACDAMYETLKNNGRKMNLVVIGPITCVAEMLTKYKDAKDYIEEIDFMAGTKEKIYGKPYKEFNASYDPEACDVVIKQNLPLVIVPMELGHFAYLDKEDIREIKKTNKVGKIYAKIFTKYRDYHVGDLGAAVHDVCAVYYLVHPEKVKTEQMHVEIKHYEDETENYDYMDLSFDGELNATVCVDMDIADFKYDLFTALRETNELF